jgi:RNA polymerase sigma-70 factor (ECF subfamily)
MPSKKLSLHRRQNRQPLATLLDVSRGRGGLNGVVSPDELNARAEAAALYERYAPRIHRFCVRRLGDRDEAADAVQDTFLRAWLALRDGAEVRFPVPWLLTIAESVCVTRFRARLARVKTTELSDRPRSDFSDAVGEVAGLATALRALPDRQRQALLRREVQGYSYDEIGAELGVSRASVAALIHRARHTVADRLRDARREVAALVPIPAILRAPLEHGAIASVAATGVAAVAIAVPQLAVPPSASSSPPTRVVGEAALMVGADHVVAARALRRAVASKRVARASTVTAPGSAARVDPATAKAADGGVVFVAEFPPLTPTAGDTPESQAAPSEEPDAPTGKSENEPAAETQNPEEPAPSSTPESEPVPNNDQPESDEGAPRKERRTPSAIRLGQEPKGEKGRSALAPGHTSEKARGSDGSNEDSNAAKPAKQKQERADPPPPPGTAAEQQSVPAEPAPETTASPDPVAGAALPRPGLGNEGQHAGAENGNGGPGDG